MKNETRRRILRYTLFILVLIPAQLAFLGLSRLLYVISDVLLAEHTETTYMAVNGLGLGLGHFLYYTILRKWKDMRSEGVTAALLGLVSLTCYLAARNTLDSEALAAFQVFSQMYLWALVWFALAVGIRLGVSVLWRWGQK